MGPEADVKCPLVASGDDVLKKLNSHPNPSLFLFGSYLRFLCLSLICIFSLFTEKGHHQDMVLTTVADSGDSVNCTFGSRYLRSPPPK